jgi:hypothetical protein
MSLQQATALNSQNDLEERLEGSFQNIRKSLVTVYRQTAALPEDGRQRVAENIMQLVSGLELQVSDLNCQLSMIRFDSRQDADSKSPEIASGNGLTTTSTPG